MLVLTRRLEEEVICKKGGTEIVVKVLGVSKEGKVKLGFTAPKDVEILRGEVLRLEPVIITREFGWNPYCEECGRPFDRGDKAYWCPNREKLYCSQECSRRDR